MERYDAERVNIGFVLIKNGPSGGSFSMRSVTGRHPRLVEDLYIVYSSFPNLRNRNQNLRTNLESVLIVSFGNRRLAKCEVTVVLVNIYEVAVI